MARRSINSSNVALLAGSSPATGAHPSSSINSIFGTTELSYETTTSKDYVFINGIRNAVAYDSIEPASATMDFTYYVADLSNERRLGFVTNGVTGAFANILNGTADERNYFWMIAPDGTDAIGANPTTTPCLAFGNGTINSWNFSAAIGDYPSSSVNVSFIDFAYYTDSDTEQIPAIDVNTGLQASGTFTLPTPSGSAAGRDYILKPNDIQINLAGLTGMIYDFNAACVQSVDISVDLSRTDVRCLGSKYRKDPIASDNIPVTLSFDMLAKDMITGRLSNFECGTGKYSATVTLRRPVCFGTGSVAASYNLRGLYYDSHNHNVSANGDGTPSTVSFTFQGTLGGINNFTDGIFMSGIAN